MDSANPHPSFVELDRLGTKFYFDGKGKARRVEQLPSARIDVLASCGNEFIVPFSTGGSQSFLILPRS